MSRQRFPADMSTRRMRENIDPATGDPRETLTSRYRGIGDTSAMTKSSRSIGTSGPAAPNFRSIGTDAPRTPMSASAGGRNAGVDPFAANEGELEGNPGGAIGGTKSLRASVADGTFGTGGGGSIMTDTRLQGSWGASSFGFSVGPEEDKPMAGSQDSSEPFLKKGQTGVKSWSSQSGQSADRGGSARTLASTMDDHVFNGNMSDKDRMQVMRAMNRKYGAKGVLS